MINYDPDADPDNDSSDPFRPCMYCVAAGEAALRPATGWRLIFRELPAKMQQWIEACDQHAGPLGLAC